jgi:hypothetical protein
MRNFIVLLGLLSIITTKAIATQGITYTYDNAGNRIMQKYVVTLLSDSSNLNNSPSEEANMSEYKIIVYPNPTKGQLMIEVKGCDDQNKAIFTLYNLQGSQLQKIVAGIEETPLDMTNYPSGYYLLRVYFDNKAVEYKIIKQ